MRAPIPRSPDASVSSGVNRAWVLGAALLLPLAGWGCAAALIPSSAAIGSAAAAAAAAIAPAVGPLAAATGVGVMAAGSNYEASKLIGKSAVGLEVCAGFSNRTSERLSPELEKWTYETPSCTVTFLLEKGIVTKVDFSASSYSCQGTVGRCL